MNFFGTNRQNRDENEEDVIPPFQSFHLTYKWTSRVMSIGMMYPNPKTDRWRLIATVIMALTSAPFIFITFIDMWRFFLENDIANVIRLSTICGPFILGIIKSFLFFYKRRLAEAIIQEIDRDYSLANDASTKIRTIVHENIKANMVFEKFWTTCVFVADYMFVLSAAVMNVYNNITEGKHGYMITDLRNPLAEETEERFSSPYFEIMFAYTFYINGLYFIYFTCNDLFFMVSIGHACLKFELFNAALEDAMLVEDEGERKEMVSAVIHEHNRAFRFVELVKDAFNSWLGIVTIAVLGQLCCCMFYILEGYGFDERYSIFTTVITLYTYLLCYRAHQLKATTEAMPTRIFCNDWHLVQDVKLWKVLPFVIARSQVPVEIRAFHYFLFDMEFFVFIVKTAYSMFTLLKK